MQIPVLIEPVAGNGFLARGLEAAAASAHGATQQEALENLRKLLQGRVPPGAQLVSLQLTASGEGPWERVAGIFDPEDPLVQEWKQIMAENRKAADADPDVP